MEAPKTKGLTAECSFSQTQITSAPPTAEGKVKSYRFRVTSADTVIGEAGYNCTEFPLNVLTPAVDKYNNVKVLFAQSGSYEHNKTLSDVVGITSNATLVPATYDIPAGIEVDITIPENLAANVIEMLNIGAIDACSSSTRFAYSESHERPSDKYVCYGDLMPDGTYFRRVVTEIIEVLEISFVFSGADKYSKLIDSTGKPVNVTSHSAEQGIEAAKTTNISSVQFSNEQIVALCTAAETTKFDLLIDKINYAVKLRKQRVEFIVKAKKLTNPAFDFSVLERALLTSTEEFVDFSYVEISNSLPAKCAKCGGAYSLRSTVDDEDYNNTQTVKKERITL